ncbi:hypothetical protein B0H14DRAFT_2617033 [Mycena olivaceomarginata]|nr:hypothetical protein B0H14DRAFT_2617033 [Mycena olivaceomarginata]
MSICTQPRVLPCQHGMQPKYVSSPQRFYTSMACSPGDDAAHTKRHFTVATVWGWETRERAPLPPVSVAAARRSGPRAPLDSSAEASRRRGEEYSWRSSKLLEEERLDGAAATIVTNPSNYLGASSHSHPGASMLAWCAAQAAMSPTPRWPMGGLEKIRKESCPHVIPIIPVYVTTRLVTLSPDHHNTLVARRFTPVATSPAQTSGHHILQNIHGPAKMLRLPYLPLVPDPLFPADGLRLGTSSTLSNKT